MSTAMDRRAPARSAGASPIAVMSIDRSASPTRDQRRVSLSACSANSRRLGHQTPGIRGVYAHVTEPMQTLMLAGLQKRWLDHGGHW